MSAKLEWGGFDGKDLEKALNAELAKVDGTNESAVVEAVKRATKKVFGKPMSTTDARKLARQIMRGK